MKQIRLLIWFVAVATALGMAQGDQSSAAPAANSQSTTVIVTPATQPSPVRILTPTAGQTLTANYVHLSFELAQPSLSGEPNFVVQLDSGDPINTSETDYTFPDLQPGPHTIRVTLVDANNSPIQGGTATVQFKVAKSDAPPGASLHWNATPGSRTLAGGVPTLPIPPELRNDGDPKLPLAGSPLPMLSLIGFGLLLGGAAQAMRMR